MAETRMTMTGAASRQGAGRRWTATRAPLTSRLAWRQCLVFLGLFFLPVSIALAQSTQQVIVSGSGVNYRTGSPNPNVWMGVESWSANNLDRLATIPDAGTVSDLRVSLDVAPGGGNSVTFTLRKDTGSGPVATALTCTITGPGANTTCSDTTNSVTVAAGDKLDILATPASNPTGSPVHYTTKYVSDTAKYTLLLGGSREDPGITDLLSYVSLSGLWTSATEFNMETVFPTGGTLRNLYVELPAPPGAGASRTFTVRKNGVSTALTCTIAGAVATSCSDTTNTVSVAARDTAVLLQTPSGSPVAARGATLPSCSKRTRPAALSSPRERSQARPPAPRTSVSSAGSRICRSRKGKEPTRPGDDHQEHGRRDRPGSRQGAGVNGYQFTLRQNGADTGLLCLVAELATTCSAGLDVTIANDDLLSLEITPINTPTAITAFHVSFCAADRAGACPAIASAVELVSFTAVGLDGAVELQWETGSEIDNLGFHLYRSLSEEGPYERITASLIPGLGSSPEGARYGYRDVGLVNGVAYFYRLEDVETTGKTELHGPVTAVPLSVSDPDPPAEEQGTEPGHEGTEPGHEEEGTEPGGGEEEGSEEGEGSSPAWMTYGDPESTSLRVVKRDERGVTLELLTGGFYAVPEPDGEVWLEIPGFENASEAGSPAIPVERSWVESVVGRKVRLDEVRAHDVVSFDSLRPVASGTPELVAEEDGTVRPVLRRRPKGKAFERPGLYPEQAARVVETAFQGETKKALVELSPLRFDRDTGQLLLARRLRVRVEFAGREPGERSRGGSRGRAYGGTRGTLSRRSAGVVARLSTRERGLYAVRFEELFGPGGRAVSSSKLRLSRQGEAVGFHLEPEGRGFSRGSVLYFVGEASTENPYGEAAVFEVSLEGGGARMPEESASPRGVSLGHYTHETRWEQDLKYQPGLVQAEDPWLWDAVVSPATKAYPLAVSGLVSASEPARLRVWLEGGSDFAVSPDHHLRLSVNGYLVAETSWDGKASQEIEALLPPGVLLEGPNAFEIENVGDTGAAYSLVFLDRYALSYPRVLEAEGGVLEGGFSRFGAAEVAGLSSGAALLDVSQDPPRWLSGTWDTGLRFAAEAGHTYLAVSPESVLAPEVRPATKATLAEPEERGGVPAAGPAGAPGARLRGRAAGAPPGPGAQCPGRGDRGRLRRVRPRRGPAGGPQGVPGLRLPLLAGAVAAVRACCSVTPRTTPRTTWGPGRRTWCRPTRSRARTCGPPRTRRMRR